MVADKPAVISRQSGGGKQGMDKHEMIAYSMIAAAHT